MRLVEDLQGNRGRLGGAFADEFYWQFVADFVMVEDAVDVLDGLDGFAVHLDNDVTEDDAAAGVAGVAAEAGGSRGSLGLDSANHGALDAPLSGVSVGDEDDAHAGTHHFSVGDQLRNDVVDGVDGDGKTDPRVRPGRALNCRVDADQPAVAVEKRTATVAWVNRGIGLDDIADRTSSHRLDFAIESADDTGSQGLVEAKGIADSKHFLPHKQVSGRPDSHGDQILRWCDFEHGEIFVGGGADNLR